MKLVRSFGFALRGIKTCFSSETNFKIQALAGIITILLGFGFQVSFTEWVALILCIAFVMAMELMNTAVEHLCNLVHREFHPGIRIIKDMAAGAVLISAVSGLITGSIIFIPKIIMFLKTI